MCYALDTSLISDMICKHFPVFYGLSSHFLDDISFEAQVLMISIFVFLLLVLSVYLRFFQTQGYEDLHHFISKSVIVLAFTFHCEFLSEFLYMERKGSYFT